MNTGLGMATEALHVLYIGAITEVSDIVDDMFKSSSARIISDIEEFSNFLEQPNSSDYKLVIAGPLIKDLSATEVAQAVRSMAPDVPIFFCHNSRDASYDRKTFKKNGFNDAFLIPFEATEFREAIRAVVNSAESARIFRSVRLLDLSPDMELTFDLHIYLPRNQKYLQYATAGRSLGLERLGKLKSHNMGAVYVSLDQMPQFFDYTAERLRSLQDNRNGLSETERRARLQDSIRGLATDIFSTLKTGSFDGGKQILADAGEIVKSYIMKGDEADLYSKILDAIGDVSSSYSHLSNVSTLASLFSMASGIGKPEDMALAGLFHDLGLSLVPPEIQEKPPASRTQEERLAYERHPELSLNLIKEKRVVLPENVQTMILQHHERFNGRGYPNQISEPTLRRESQLLAFSDRFDELMQIEPGRARVGPQEALDVVASESIVNPRILEKLRSLFPPLEPRG